jgi:hypothetical protein
MHGPESAERASLIHRELLRLGLLAAVAVAAFFLTKALAASNRDLDLRNAAEWYSRGEALVRAGDLAHAIEAYRRATVRNRDNRSYQLALARALVLDRDYDAARALLLRIRESAPEDAQINLDLARVAAARQDVTEATRFYHDALYAPWAPSEFEARRAVRVELIRFLVTHNQGGRAWAELLAAAADIPDHERRRTDLVDIVMARDPMAPRLRSRDRQRRLEADVAYVEQRFSACLAAAGPARGDDTGIRDELQALELQLRRQAPLDQDTLEASFDLIARAERESVTRCGPATDDDQALQLIAREHGAPGK